MCGQPNICRTFDPEACPLLKGLSPEERRRRIAEDPIIRNCVAAVEGAREVSRETAKLTAAYAKRRARNGQKNVKAGSNASA